MSATGRLVRPLRAALPDGRVVRVLSVAALADAVGNGFFIAGSAVFFTVHLGMSAGTVGLGLSLAGAAGLLASALAGRLTDRLGARRVYVALSLVQALLFACYPLLGDRTAVFFLVLCAIGVAEYGAAPAWGTLVARSVPADRRVRTRAYLRSVYNVGFSLGSLACGAVVAIGTPAAFVSLALGNAVTFAVGALVVLAVPAPPVVPAAPGGSALRYPSLRDGSFLAVTGLSAVLCLHVSVLLVALPLWVVERTDVAPSAVGALLVVNTVLVVLLQVRASGSAEQLAGAAVAARRAGILMAAACGVFALGQGRGWVAAGITLLVGVVLLTGAELLQAASAWGLPYGLAPESRLGEYQGTFGMAFSAQTMIGPALTVYLVIEHGWIGWAVLAALVLAAALLIVPATRRAARSTRAGLPVGAAA